MANPEHLEILKQGVEVWNQWRKHNLEIVPNFTQANLDLLNLNGANLQGSQFRSGHISNTKLIKANLFGADFTAAILSYTDLTETDLTAANFNHAYLFKVIFSNAKLGYTLFCNNDLSDTTGLETVRHLSPSTIGIDTIFASKGTIPEDFLRNAGVSENLIKSLPSIIGKAEEFYSCFISYSSKDQPFAFKLRNDLQANRVRCWYAPEDLRIGDEIRTKLDISIGQYDKLLLILSKHSVASDWVKQEVETALDRERKLMRTILFPIRLDYTAMKIDTGWPALIKNTRNIGDFTRWKDHDSYRKAFDRLLRDLKAEDKDSLAVDSKAGEKRGGKK